MKNIEEKIGGNYDDLINELGEVRQTLNAMYDNCATQLAKQILEELLEKFDNVLVKYENEKDIEIIEVLDK